MTSTIDPTNAETAAPAAPSATPDDALRAGKPPVGTGASPLFAQLIAVAFIALGVVGVQHLLAQLGVISQSSWVLSAIKDGDGIKGDDALVLVVGIVAVVLGVLLLPVVFRRRPRTSVDLTALTGVHLRTRDLSRITEAALADADGVTGVRVKAGRRKIRVVATSVAGEDRNAAVTGDLRSRLDRTLAALENQPKVTVTIRNDDVS